MSGSVKRILPRDSEMVEVEEYLNIKLICDSHTNHSSLPKKLLGKGFSDIDKVTVFCYTRQGWSIVKAFTICLEIDFLS